MLHRDRVEREYGPLFRDLGLGATTWSPLASGLLSGKYGSGIPAGSRATLPGYEWLREAVITKERIEIVKRLQPVADELRCTLAQLAIAWCLGSPNVSTVILGASRVSQLRENLAAAEVAARLTPEVLERIEAILGNRPKNWRAI